MPALELDARTWAGLDYLESLSGPGAIAEIVEAYRRDAPDRLARMRAALGAEEREQLGRLAHDLKANSATLGVLALADLAADLERNARDGLVEDLTATLEAAEALLPRVLLLLEERAGLYPA